MPSCRGRGLKRTVRPRWLPALIACWLVAPAYVRAEPVLGDFDGDADIDLADLSRFMNCFSGTAPSTTPSCDIFDFLPGGPIGPSDFELFSCGWGGPGAIVEAISVDPSPSPVSNASIVLTGSTAGAILIQVTGGATPVTVGASNCSFVAPVQLRPNAVNRLFVTGVFGDGSPSAPVAVTITHDAQAPTLFVDFPAAGANITTPTTDVAGRVSDTLSGFADMRVKVAVNDGPFVPAALDIGVGANGTYFLSQVPLVVGSNTIEVTAIDGLGNGIRKPISVTRVEVPVGTPQMTVHSGNVQSARIHEVLAQPIEVQVVGAKGLPLAGKLILFTVVRSDGRLAGSPAGLLPGTASFQAFTDSQGIARAFWRLGSDAGRGNNRVEVTSDSVVGTTLFCASATAAPPRQINIGGGNNQRAQAGALAPERLNIWVNDSCNPVAGVPVTFAVRQGGGTIDGEDSVTLNTDSSGHTEVGFVLGAIGGNNVVEATFTGNPNAPAVFTIFGVERATSEPTSFSGLVLDNAGQPIQGATCALVVGGVTLPFAFSDINGVFRFDNLTVSGPADVHVAGASATHIGGPSGINVPPNSFPSLRYSAIIIPNAANSLPTPVLLPQLNPANARLYSTTQDTELTVAGMAGLKMIVKAGSMRIRSGGQFVPAPNGTAISLNQVQHEDVPMPLPDGASPPFAWTLQPGGAQFDPPITIFYPNISGLPAGSIANFLSFNHDSGKFEIIASGHVTNDGTTIVSDPGSGISLAGWGCNCPPYSVTGQCCHCLAPCQTCVVGACVPTGNGSPCGSTCCAAGQSCCEGSCCNAGQECCNGSCVAPGQTCCDDGSTCPSDETCCQGNCCGQGEECCDGTCCLADQQCCFGGDNVRCISASNTCCDNGTECFPPEFPMCCGASCCVADGICCDDECQIPGSECCFAGKVCSPPTPRCCGDNCCAEGVECCNGACAAPGAHCCDDANFCSGETPQCCVETCCAADAVCCDGACAPPGSVCCDGRACPGDTPQCCGEKNCCPADAFCCGDTGLCCPPDTMTCCGETCCGVDELCCNDSCHPAPGTCCDDGTVCSGLGAVCCDAGCFPEGSVCCPDGRGCPGETPLCCGQENCCPADATCCNDSGVCCSATQTCCGDAACCDVDEECCNGSCHPAPGVCCPDGTFCSGLDAVCCNGTCAPEGSACCEDGRTCPGETPLCCGQDNCCPADALCCGASGLCCSDIQTCCGPGACCDVDEECCNESCHPAPGICCPDGSFCSGLDAVCCNGGCCTESQECCDGECVPPGHCCSDGRQFCVDICCSAATECCEGQCLPPTQCCSDGRQFCGDLCCSAGAVCCSGTCTPESQCCSDGRPFCGDLCCNAGAVCCSGTCTPENQCCSDGRPFCGQLCCNTSSFCCNGQCRPTGSPCP